MTMQTASGNNPLHLQAAARPKARPESANAPKRLRLAEAVQKSGRAEQAEGEREDIQHRRSRLDEQHLVEEGDQRRRDRGPLRREQRETAEIDRDDRERAEQCGRIAPAERIVAERCESRTR